MNEEKKKAVNSKSEKRLGTLHAHCLKAFRKDRKLIHLGEKK